MSNPYTNLATEFDQWAKITGQNQWQTVIGMSLFKCWMVSIYRCVFDD